MTPVLQSLLIADNIFTDAITGRRIICGVFNAVGIMPKLPAAPDGKLPVMPCGYDSGSPFIYVSLTDVHGKQEFQLRYVDLKNDTVLLQLDFEVESKNPLTTVEAVFPDPRLPISEAGVFAFELLWNDQPLGSQRISVENFKPEGQAHDES